MRLSGLMAGGPGTGLAPRGASTDSPSVLQIARHHASYEEKLTPVKRYMWSRSVGVSTRIRVECKYTRESKCMRERYTRESKCMRESKKE